MQTGKKILLIDDDADLRQALRKQLKLLEEFEIWEAGSGSEALVMLKNDGYTQERCRAGCAIEGRERNPRP